MHNYTHECVKMTRQIPRKSTGVILKVHWHIDSSAVMGKTRRLVEPSPPEKEPENPAENAPLAGSWLKIVRGLVGVASLVTVYLAYVSLALGGGVPGCGPDSGCDRVLSSPWAYWLGIPVSLPGLVLYAIFLINTFSLRRCGNTRRGWWALTHWKRPCPVRRCRNNSSKISAPIS